jgi:hypothetical protein
VREGGIQVDVLCPVGAFDGQSDHGRAVGDLPLAVPLLDDLQDAEVSPVAEHDIAQDQQRPAVADHLRRGVDRAARARVV